MVRVSETSETTDNRPHSAFIVFGTRGAGLLGLFGTEQQAVDYASKIADHEVARGINAHLLLQEWGGNILFRTIHVYGTDHPMNGPFREPHN